MVQHDHLAIHTGPRLRPTCVDHLVFRVSDMASTERFYTALLGQPLKERDWMMFTVGETRVFFSESPRGAAARYDKEAVGLNHMAFGLRTRDELEAVERQLNGAGVAHSGITFWEDRETEYLWLDDPDGMRVEFWLRRQSPV